MSQDSKPASDQAVRNRRSAARLFALQALYQSAMNDQSIDAVITEFLAGRIEEANEAGQFHKPDQKLFIEIARGVERQREELDNMVAGFLDPGWPIDRLELILRLLFRCGAYELAERPNVPRTVVVSEYVDLAKAYFGGKEPGMVNGLLDRLSRQLRPDEVQSNHGRG